MKTIRVISLVATILSLYWVIIVQISINHFNNATHQFILAATVIENKEESMKHEALAHRYKSKAENILLWLPKPVRP